MSEMLTQAQYMRRYNETHREEFNPAYFERSNKDIMNCMKKIILSCERDKYFTVKVLDMREVYNYEEIINLLRDHEEKRRKKGSKDENPYDFININESDIMLLQVKYFIRHNGYETQKIDNVDTLVKDPWEILDVLIVLPRYTRKYYFKLNGNYYSDIFQIVDGSTYNNANNGLKSKKAPNNTFKSIFTPIKMYRMYKDIPDIDGKVVRHHYYTTIINIVFNTHHNTMLYFLACFGFYGTLEFFGIDPRSIIISKEPIKDENWICIEKHGIYIAYSKIVANDPIVPALVVTFYDAIKNDTTVSKLYDIHYWLVVLASYYGNATVDKGLFILDTLDGVYDMVTHDDLHLPEEQKTDIYCILRWMMREFANIRKKNNVDVTTKRYRVAEPIVTTYAKKLIVGLSRVADSGKKVTLMGVRKAIYTSPMYVINQITTMSNLIAYRDMVNDNDATTALKYTYKGISGLGDSGTSIQAGYRYVDPSHAGILDLDSSTTSDPGMSGTICPLSKTYGGSSFSEYQEPNEWDEVYKPYHDQFKEQFNKDSIINPIHFEKEQPKKDLFAERKEVVKESLDIDKVIEPIHNIDPSIDYTTVGSKLKELERESKNLKNMFTIVKENE